MKEIFCDNQNPRELRNKADLKTSNIKHVYNGSETISYRGSQIWELVPHDIKLSKSLEEFKKGIKSWKPQGCACRLCKTYIHRFGFI